MLYLCFYLTSLFSVRVNVFFQNYYNLIFPVPYWQLVPVYPVKHVHVYPPRLLIVHFALFKHGLLRVHGRAFFKHLFFKKQNTFFKFSNTSNLPYWQFVPVYPVTHEHVYPPMLLLVHVAPFLHGLLRTQGKAFD